MSDEFVLNQSKLKLDQIWSEVQKNLPSIDFDDDQNCLSNEEDENLDLILDKAEDILNDFEPSFDKLTFDNEEQVEESSSRRMDFLNSPREANFKHKEANSNDNEIMSQLESMNKINKVKKNHFSKQSNLDESLNKASKITKTIFESTNSKLSMNVLNNLNIDEILENVQSSTNYSKSLFTSPYSGNKIQQNSRTLNDENLMKKLTELSLQYSKESNTNVNRESVATGFSNEFVSSALKMVEREFGSESANLSKYEQENTRDLIKFLNSHNIKDGNLVETRKLDLRSSQTMPSSTKQRIYSKQNAESLFQDILISDSKNALLNKTRFLNESDSSRSSESDSEKDNSQDAQNSSLWIERYRKHKMMLSNKNK